MVTDVFKIRQLHEMKALTTRENTTRTTLLARQTGMYPSSVTRCPRQQTHTRVWRQRRRDDNDTKQLPTSRETPNDDDDAHQIPRATPRWPMTATIMAPTAVCPAPSGVARGAGLTSAWPVPVLARLSAQLR